ncbi:MAG TPA: PAS domain-containing sensor histidine kinase [Albitalea sp.]|nr:PAS domain-containing sensor histidine kinase [Albitalea sp.]HUG25182.1 PAS domain-containing sensor histidine kinase [Albitalea sp.]
MSTGGTAAWTDRLKLLLESTGEGIFGIDMDGCCTFINRAGAQMLGWRTEEVLGRNMHRLIHHSRGDGDHYPEADCPIFNAFRQGLPCRIDSEVLWRADGSAFSAEYSSHPILDGGEVQGAVVTFVDITERKHAEELLRQARDELEQRVAARTAELSSAMQQLRDLSAHVETVREDERTRIARDIHDELGSLLVALKMDVNWLEKRVGDRPELQCKCHGMGRLIDTAVDNVGRIITDLRPSILDHQGLWAALEWQAQEFIETTELRHELQVHVAAGVAPPGGVAGERWAIAVFRIFQEMLSNVARHAKARSVGIRLYVDGPPDPVLHLEVRDDGVGAPRAALDDPRSYGVMGMRERAGHFGGRVSVQSEPGQGTCVRLTMPLPQQKSEGATP